ncbi:GntR family transcriptional regulator [Variovorax sp. RCC_210]|uniref:GntR family transcriptional regulator n=1 Tax=Variovorax sp. RCC_210 TaxID=3239217 RepID=UPI003525F060
MAETLRNKIFDGVFAPGCHLMEIALATELGVSRTPVRGAMARLADEGLLVYLPNKGFQVRRFNAKDVFDAFTLRANLEGMACRLLGERGIDDEVFAQLAALVGEQARLLQNRDWTSARALRWHELNLDFHRKLLQAADNRWLTEAVYRACQLPIIFDSNLRPHNRDASMQLYRHEQALQALDDHTRILEALGQRDGVEAEAAMRDHILGHRDLLVHHLRKNATEARAMARV